MKPAVLKLPIWHIENLYFVTPAKAVCPVKPTRWIPAFDGMAGSFRDPMVKKVEFA